MTNEKYLILDVETTNSIEDPLCYDIGFIVADRFGNIYEKHSYVVADIFLDPILMECAYFAEKIPEYWEDLKNGSRQMRKFSTIRHILVKTCRKYNINRMYAFNSRFDYLALNITERYLTKSKYRYFFPYDVSKGVNDIMKLGKELAKEQDYKDFCKANIYLTKNGRPQIKAETIARYLFDNTFTEEHKGLEDCEIEYKILVELGKKYPQIDTRLWG